MKWPDYQEILSRGWKKQDGTVDLGYIDLFFCKSALQRGYTRDEILKKLLEVSKKARSEWDSGNQSYVEQTLDAAMGLDQFLFD